MLLFGAENLLRSAESPHARLISLWSAQLVFNHLLRGFLPNLAVLSTSGSKVSADIFRSSMGAPEAAMFRAGHLI